MDSPEIRLQLALRLKAARYLAGGLRATKKGRDGKGGQEAAALSVEELVKREPLRVNGIAVDRIQGYEQMRLAPRPMELERIADGLGVPAAFLLGKAAAEGQDAKLDEILTVMREMQARVRERYEELGEVVRQRLETERRLRHMSVEEADEVIRLLHEARMRLGRDVGMRSLPAARGEERREARGADGP